MSNKFDLDIRSVKAAENTFGTQIEIGCEARAKGGFQLKVQGASADAWLQLEARPIRKRVARTSFSGRNLGTITSSGDSVFDVYLDLSPHILERIERLREGGDVTVQVKIQFRGRDAKSNDDMTASIDAEYAIRAAEWAEILRELGYHNTRTFEIRLDASSAITRDILHSASAKVDRAQRRHDEGDYGSAIRTCRDAIESLQHIKEEVNASVDQQKWEEISSQMGQFRKGFVGLLCHSEDRTGTTPPMRRDSDFVLAQTKSYMRFIAAAIEEKP